MSMEKPDSFGERDYRLYDPDGDGQSKLDHVAKMLNCVVESKQLPFTTVLMDSWYATQKLMAQIDQLQKVYYCPLKTNRRVDDSGGTASYQRVDELVWSVQQLQQGKPNKIRGFPASKKVKLFRVTVSTNRTDFVVTNDNTQASTDAVQKVCCIRWKIEEFHRELKQLTGVEEKPMSHSLESSATTLPVPCSFGVVLKPSLTKQAKLFISLSMRCSQIT